MIDEEEICEECEQECADLNDDGYCESCQLNRDIRKAEALRDSAGDR